jgi:hypothetical protein
VVVVAAAVLVVVAPWSVAAVHGLLAGLVAISTGRTVRGGGATPAVRVALVAFAVGVVLFAGGRTDGPLCEPRSLAQAHAGWHVATAIAAAALVTTGVRHVVAMRQDRDRTPTHDPPPDAVAEVLDDRRPCPERPHQERSPRSPGRTTPAS